MCMKEKLCLAATKAVTLFYVIRYKENESCL